MAIQIAGTTAFVTGANRGIGRALVDALLARGAAKVYAAARRTEALDELVAASGGRVVPSSRCHPAAEVRAAAALADDVRLLINNAGVVAKFGGDFVDPQWLAAGREEYEVNVLGALAVTQAFVPALTKRRGTAVANISSVAGLANLPVLISYSLSKAALHSLTQATRALLAPQGVQVAGIYPGPIDTDMARPIELDKATPADAANAILDGLEAGREEIFPDPFSAQLGELFLRSPKALEQQLSAPQPAAA